MVHMEQVHSVICEISIMLVLTVLVALNLLT